MSRLKLLPHEPFKRLKRLKRVILHPVVGLSLFVLLILVYFLAREMRLIKSFEANSWTEDQTADCAVVLTGGPARVREGFDLLARKNVSKLIISGVHPQAQLRQIFPQWPYYGNLREQDVILERQSRTTYGNAQQSLALIETLQCRDVILITSRLHMYRAFQTFKTELPANISLFPRAVISTSERHTFEVALEALKSLFYSTWAY